MLGLQGLATRVSGGSREGSRAAVRSGSERRHRRPTSAAAAPPPAASGAAPSSEAEAAAQAAEADGALERFTEFLARHESELQPRTRQVSGLLAAATHAVRLVLSMVRVRNPTSKHLDKAQVPSRM